MRRNGCVIYIDRKTNMGEKEIQKINEWIEKLYLYESRIPMFNNDSEEYYNTMRELSKRMMWVDNPYEVAVLVIDKN